MDLIRSLTELWGEGWDEGWAVLELDDRVIREPVANNKRIS